MLKGKKILLCLSGGIAVYKSAYIASMLVKEGAIVKTVMTKAAMEFVQPLTFQTITKETVSWEMFERDTPVHHISLADWAELIVIAPATANVIGKIANGIADDLLSTTVMAAKCPKLIVPAMNVNMWENPITAENIDKLKKYGYHILEPATGYLACGYEGKGRMPEPPEILFAIKTALYYQQDLKGKKVLITAGASIERLDPMRHITNVSSGKMGVALARACFLRGAEVTLVHSHLSEPIPYYTNNIQALSAEAMHKAVIDIHKDFDIVIMAAAVADYTPAEPADQKIKKSEDMTIHLKRTVDILGELGTRKSELGINQYLIGFAAESEDLIQNAHSKLKKKNLDMIVANDLSVAGKHASEVNIITKGSDEILFFSGDKYYIANKIIDSSGLRDKG